MLIATGDEDAVSVRAVAALVGCSAPAIYLHFADKDELLFAICENLFLQLDNAGEMAAAAASDPLDALCRRGRAYIRFGVENPEPYRILFMRGHGGTPAELDAERLQGAAAFGHLVDEVRRCMDAGALPAGDAFLVATGFWVAVHGVTSLLIAHPGFPWPDVDQLIDHVLGVQVRGLASA